MLTKFNTIWNDKSIGNYKIQDHTNVVTSTVNIQIWLVPYLQ